MLRCRQRANAWAASWRSVRSDRIGWYMLGLLWLELRTTSSLPRPPGNYTHDHRKDTMRWNLIPEHLTPSLVDDAACFSD